MQAVQAAFSIHDPMNDLTLRDLQQRVDDWIKTYGVRYFSELTNMAILTEEVGEVARIIARKYGDQSFKESDKTRHLADEMRWPMCYGCSLVWPIRREST